METGSGDCNAEPLAMETEKEPQPKEPPRIHRLEQSVVNRIAAGEVIQRPVSAVKELVENSLDAKSTSINVVVKDGGLKLIQVSDDGHGIQYEDLPILCERHTTSKLSTFEDLQSMKSMGFRGEALASMTYVGHVTVTTITKGQLHGYRVSYRDGVMEHEPKACAAVKGTQIMVENLFYNMIARRKTLQNAADDYPKIVDLLSRFSIHHVHVGFSCRKHGASRADVHTVSTSSRLDAIRSVYGLSVARSLIKIETSDNNPSSSVFKMDGFISDSNYIAKKITMVLFINDRLVECNALKRAIEIVYAATLPKASKPFIYMSIVLPPEHVDVNVHPTKKEVSLLNQEVIIEKIQTVVESKLRNSNEAWTFQEQRVESSPSDKMAVNKDSNFSPSSSGSKSQKVPVHKMVRTDSSEPAGRLHAYLQAKPRGLLENNPSLAAVRSSVRQRRNPKETADLTSIQELIKEIDCDYHPGLLEVVRHCTYIGMAPVTLFLSLPLLEVAHRLGVIYWVRAALLRRVSYLFSIRPRIMDNGVEERLLGSEAEEQVSLRQKIWVEVKRMWKIAFPSIVARVTSFGLLVVAQLFLARVGNVQLAAFSLAQSLLLRFVNGILLGMSSATETLCGQAFGAGQYHMMGIYLQRSWIVDTVTATVLLPLFIFATPIFRALGEEEAIAVASGPIALWMIPIQYSFVFTLTVQMYLQAQQKNMIIAWLSAGGFLLEILTSWIFVNVLDLGVAGAMGAYGLSSWLLVLGGFVYVFGGWCPNTWKGFTLAAFKDIWPVVKLSVSSGVMLCLELWYNSVLVLCAGYLQNATVEISAFSICLNICAWEFMLCLGFLTAACVRVANELGAGNAKAAKFSIKVILCFSLSIGIIFWALCLAFGSQIGYLFTSDEEIAEAISSLSTLLAFSILLNSIQPVLSGVAIGAGLQGTVAFINIGCYYFFGVPVALLLGYVAKLEVQGLWIGLLSGVLMQTIALAFMIWRVNWDEQVKKASERLNRWVLNPSEESN